MLNFWISLYVSIVITVFGSLMIGSDGQQVQISRIGSQDQIRTQDGPRTSPSKLSQQTLPTPPDEQQSQDPGTDLTKSTFPGPGSTLTDVPHIVPQAFTPHDKFGSDPTKNICETPRVPHASPQRILVVVPHGKKTTVPHYTIQYTIYLI